MDARTALNEYMQKGERVDGVLHHLITQDLDKLQAIVAQKNREYDLACEHEMSLLQENKRLREALEEILTLKNYVYPTEYVLLVESLARQALQQK